ncbi:acyl carrier protein [Corynebacterium caspium]|uniref:acyl carrier protein n=1 Tax=Corynebacterium caspium TaxID=234828 RepID=UPI0003709EB0|nr:acyl carrier protein [Corynebacterium caspium]WKD59674.1 Meromycolate extension acyl carrier protein [Corynebacterium caspium DSM 44850]
MSDLAAQLAAKFHSSMPLQATASNNPGVETKKSPDTASTAPAEAETAAVAAADRGPDPRAAADPLLADFAALVSKVTGIDREEITRESKLREQAITSLNLIEILIRTEQELGVRLDENKILALTTVDELLSFIKAKRTFTNTTDK